MLPALNNLFFEFGHTIQYIWIQHVTKGAVRVLLSTPHSGGIAAPNHIATEGFNPLWNDNGTNLLDSLILSSVFHPVYFSYDHGHWISLESGMIKQDVGINATSLTADIAGRPTHVLFLSACRFPFSLKTILLASESVFTKCRSVTAKSVHVFLVFVIKEKFSCRSLAN